MTRKDRLQFWLGLVGIALIFAALALAHQPQPPLAANHTISKGK